MKIATVLGSARQGNQTQRVLAVVQDELQTIGCEVIEIIPGELKLGSPGYQTDETDKQWMIDQIKSADGVILSTPEYHGSYSSVIKMAIENMGFPSAIKGKPVALVGVASGRIGAIKALEHLRSVASHVGGLVLPGPISVAQVDRQFDEDGNMIDPKLEKFVRNLAHELINYIKETTCPDDPLEEQLRR